MKNLKIISSFVLGALVTMSFPQGTISWFQVGLHGEDTIHSIGIQIPRVFEFWLVNATAEKPAIDLVGPQLELTGKGSLVRVGPYLRYANDGIARVGGAGIVILGKRSNWQLISPFYLFAQDSGSNLDQPGVWLPNSRITYPLGNGFRGGVGTSLVALDGRALSLAAGPYISWENDKVLVQLRIGEQLSPSVLTGRTQASLLLTHKF